MYIWLIIYLLIVLILFIGQYVIFNHYKKLFEFIVLNTDEIIFEYSKVIYLQQNNIINFEDALDILFNNIKKFIYHRKRHLQDFQLFYDNLKKDIYYLEHLLEINYFDKQEFSKIELIFDLTKKLRKINNLFFYLLSTLTLGIYYIFFSYKQAQ